MEEQRYIDINRKTGHLELQDLPGNLDKDKVMEEIYMKFAFEPLDRDTLEKMNQLIVGKLEI